MINPIILDEAYQEFNKNLHRWLPDGILPINLKLLSELGLLSAEEFENEHAEDFAQEFHVVETNEKVTLYNERIVVWIVPQNEQEISSTLAMIALLKKNTPQLEIAYRTTGVYNTPKYILKVLQHFIEEITDTEAILSSIKSTE